MTVLAVALALAAALLYAASAALKHRAAGGQPDVLTRGGAGRLLGLLLRTLRHPLWLTGIAADVGGLACQAVALHLGGLVLVQPILVTAVVEGLALRSLLDRRWPRRRDLLLAGALLVALAGFVTPLQLGSGVGSPGIDRAPAYVFALLGLVLVAAAASSARVVRSGEVAASALGAASGILYAGAAALLTLVTVQWTRYGLLGVLSRDEVYALLVAGAGSQLLNQVSFGAGPLAASSPVSTSVDLVASVALGIVVFDHPLPHGALRLSAALVSLVAACCVVAALGRGGSGGSGGPGERDEPGLPAVPHVLSELGVGTASEP